MVDIWLLCRVHGGPYSARPLPTAGGPGEQPAALLDAFALLDGIAADAKTS